MRLAYFLLLSVLPLFLGATDISNMVDPTRPPSINTRSATDQTPSSMKLTATYIYPNRHLAIINGAIVKEGDQIGEYTVTTISRYTVELMGSQNNKEVLQLVTPIKQKR